MKNSHFISRMYDDYNWLINELNHTDGVGPVKTLAGDFFNYSYNHFRVEINHEENYRSIKFHLDYGNLIEAQSHRFPENLNILWFKPVETGGQLNWYLFGNTIGRLNNFNGKISELKEFALREIKSALAVQHQFALHALKKDKIL